MNEDEYSKKRTKRKMSAREETGQRGRGQKPVVHLPRVQHNEAHRHTKCTDMPSQPVWSYAWRDPLHMHRVKWSKGKFEPQLGWHSVELLPPPRPNNPLELNQAATIDISLLYMNKKTHTKIHEKRKKNSAYSFVEIRSVYWKTKIVNNKKNFSWEKRFFQF